MSEDPLEHVQLIRSWLRKFFLLPLNIDIEKVKIEEKQTLEVDPNKIRPGEASIVKVPKWGGFGSEFFAVLNIDGKRISVEQLRRKTEYSYLGLP